MELWSSASSLPAAYLPYFFFFWGGGGGGGGGGWGEEDGWVSMQPVIGAALGVASEIHGSEVLR